LPRVQLITPDDEQRGCPKHVEFYDKIKFWILDASCWLFIRRFIKYKKDVQIMIMLLIAADFGT
jgi:hypothetical protein